jgi:hypothetical protein
MKMHDRAPALPRPGGLTTAMPAHGLDKIKFATDAPTLRIWFAYQGSLRQGCNRLSVIISELPVSEQTTELLIKLLLRLDDKLSRGGVDDSDGTVGGFIEETVHALEQYAKLDPACT